MKILVLCNKPPYPPKDGGAIAIYNLSKSLALLGHQVTIYAMETSKHKVETNVPDKNIELKYSFVDTRINPLKALINLIFSKFPYNAERFVSKKYLKGLEDILKANQFDAVHFEGPYVGFCLETVRKYSNAKLVLKSHNIENEIWERSGRLEKNIFKKYYFTNLAKRIRKFEESLYNNFDFIFAITERDKNELLKLGLKKPVLVVPVGIDPPKLKKIDMVPDSVFYIGALDWIPNQEALTWFVDNIWPKLYLKYTGLRFHVAGRNAPSWIINYLKKTGIVYHGEIEDSHSFIRNMGIMVVPLFAGSGMRVKIIEGMSLGKSIVTTSIGAEGLDVSDSYDILIADDPETFYNKICSVLDDKTFQKQISENAIDSVSKKYRNSDIATKVVDFYKLHEVTTN